MGRAGGWNPVLRELQSARVFWPTKLNLVCLRGYGKSQYLVCELRDPLTQRVCTLQPWMSHPVCAGWWMQGRWAHCRFWSSWQCPACLDGWRLGQIEGIKFLDILCRTQFKLNFKNILFKETFSYFFKSCNLQHQYMFKSSHFWLVEIILVKTGLHLIVTAVTFGNQVTNRQRERDGSIAGVRGCVYSKEI